MSTVTLNFARKWRSKQFDQIIGQELPVRMLKNSLYLDHYFPVYLFAGQRGSGKTSTARIFAAAINCEALSQFQANPKDAVLPCLTCGSCRAMSLGQHPDFCEIDAASHTGVDMIRQVIDASLLLPLLGRKKIYLIDEAHMLSKASFNALLKILEEPPHTVVFMLATTDPQKIIETVRSRCFQLFFKPVEHATLTRHLTMISTAENVGYDPAGIALIAQESDGSVRDAINLLEQVRFATDRVTKDAVLRVLGHVDDERLLTLIEALLSKTPGELLSTLSTLGFEQCSPVFIWTRLSALLRDALWVKYGVASHQCDAALRDRLQAVVKQYPVNAIHLLLDYLYRHEALFLKTTAQHAMLEMILLQMCLKSRGYKDGSGGASPIQQQASVVEAVHEETELEHEEQEGEESDEEEEDSSVEDLQDSELWTLFVRGVHALDDPLLQSLFSQAHFVSFDQTTARLEVAFSKDFVFFKDWLEEKSGLWMPLLKKVFSDSVVWSPLFTQDSAVSAPVTRTASVQAPVQSPAAQKKSEAAATTSSVVKPFYSAKPRRSTPVHMHGTPLDISDQALWPKAHMIVRYFPSTVYALHEEGQ